MRDGITLSADVYLPLGGGVAADDRAVDAVRVDARALHLLGRLVRAARLRGGRRRRARPLRVGRAASPRGRTTASDAHDTLTWAAGEQWCNGRVGTWGRSYGGLVQWQLAHLGHPNLALHRAAGDPRRLLLGRLLDGRRVPARADARRRRALVERDEPDHRPERARHRAERPRLRAPAADRARRGDDRPQGRLLARSGGSTRRTTSTGTQFHHRPEKVDVPIFQQGGWFDPYSGSHLRIVRADRRAACRTAC